MIKRFTPLVIAATVLTLAVGCKGKDSVANDPKAVLTSFFEKMAKKDIDGAAKLVTKDSKGTMEMMKKAMSAAEQMKELKTSEKDPTEEFANMEFGESKIDGDNATVSVHNKKKDETIDFPLKKEGGSWKVDFSMGTLMKMGMNQAGKNKDLMNDFNNSMDSTGLSDKMHDLMNSDSLKMGLEKMDSVIKNIDPEKLKKLEDALKSLEKMKE
ncbi:MAG: hypothetical protein ACRDEB_00615 [Chitinophagaceae bacterium]